MHALANSLQSQAAISSDVASPPSGSANNNEAAGIVVDVSNDKSKYTCAHLHNCVQRKTTTVRRRWTRLRRQQNVQNQAHPANIRRIQMAKAKAWIWIDQLL
jgi:hypothetical protein